MTEPAESRGEGREIAPKTNVLARAVEDGVVLVDLETNRIYELNRTAGRTWTLLGEGLSLDEIEARVAEEFSVDRETVKAELEALVEELLDQQLLVRSE